MCRTIYSTYNHTANFDNFIVYRRLEATGSCDHALAGARMINK